MATKKTLADFKPDERNANRGTDRGRRIIRQSVERNGFGRPLLADKHGTLVAGNQTRKALEDAGLTVREVHTTGNEIIIHVRDDLDLASAEDERGRRLAYEDNIASAVGLEWDAEQVRADAVSLDLSDLFRPAEFERLFRSLQPEIAFQPSAHVAPAQGPAEADEAPPRVPVVADDNYGRGAPLPEASTNYVRMVQLFLSAAQYDELHAMVDAFRKRYDADNLTDAVMEALRHAYATE